MKNFISRSNVVCASDRCSGWIDIVLKLHCVYCHFRFDGTGLSKTFQFQYIILFAILGGCKSGWQVIRIKSISLFMSFSWMIRVIIFDSTRSSNASIISELIFGLKNEGISVFSKLTFLVDSDIHLGGGVQINFGRGWDTNTCNMNERHTKFIHQMLYVIFMLSIETQSNRNQQEMVW